MPEEARIQACTRARRHGRSACADRLALPAAHAPRSHPAPALRARRAPATRYAPRMRSKRSWAWAGLGASSLLAFLTACGSVNETFEIKVNGADSGTDSGPSPSDATVADASAPDATSDATVPDGSVQDAQVDAAVDAGSGPVVPDGGSIIMVGDAAVVIPPLDPGLLGDGGIRLSDGGLANADGGALTPRQFRDLVNGITCQRISECCCPGCTAGEQAQTVSRTKCADGLGSNGFQLSLNNNERIPEATLRSNTVAQAQCIALLNQVIASCQSTPAELTAALRGTCLRTFVSANGIGDSCSDFGDCASGAFCSFADAGSGTCRAVKNTGESCATTNECSYRGVSGAPPNYCNSTDAGATCAPYRAEGDLCTASSQCGAGACTVRTDGTRRCSNTLPFAATGDPASFCTRFAP